MVNNKARVGIKLDKFKMSWIGDNKIIVMIGPRGRGKSTIILDYLYHNQDIPFTTCISPSDIYNHTFTPYIPSRFIYAKYTPTLLENYLHRQQTLKSQKKKAEMGYGDLRYKDVDCRGLLVMDDCLADNKGWKTDPSLRWIFFNGRHADVTYILTMQYQVGIPPEFRVNIDWVFLLRDAKKQEKEKLYKYYAGIFPSFDMFDQIFMKCTKNKCCLVVHSLSESDRIEDQVFWFKAEQHTDNFRICYDEFWEDNEYYVKKRLAISDPTTNLTTQQQSGSGGGGGEEADDYYRYVGGGRSKVMYDVNMSNEYLGEDDYA